MWGELSSECGASRLGASCLQGKLSWGELSLARVVRFPLYSPAFVGPSQKPQRRFSQYTAQIYLKRYEITRHSDSFVHQNVYMNTVESLCSH